MITISILEDNDVIGPDDWCRPLSIVSMNGGMSDYYEFGPTNNNVRWQRVKYVLGKPWHGCTAEKIGHGLGKYCQYEFVRGEVPRSHCEKTAGLTDHSKVFRSDEEYDDDIPF